MKNLIVLLFTISIAINLYSQKKIKIGIDDNYPPYEYVNELGEAEGFNVDLYKSIFSEYNYQIEFLPKSWDLIYQIFRDEEVDVLSMLYSDNRNKAFLLSVPHNRVTYTLFYHKSYNEKIEKLEYDHSIIIVKDDIMHEYLQEYGGFDNIFTVSSAEEALLMLNIQKDRIAVLPKLQALYYINIHKLKDLRVTTHVFYPQRYCFAVNNGSQELMYYLNEGLAIAKENGTYDKLYEKWFFQLEEDKKITFLSLVKDYYPVLFIIISLFFVIIIWNFTLKREVVRRNKDLSEELMARERSEMAIIESEDRFRTLSENSPAAIIIFNEKKLYFANKAAHELCGIKEVDISSLLISDFFAEEHQSFFDTLLKKSHAERDYSIRETLKVLQKDGTSKWIDITFIKSYYKAEPVLIGTGFDTTSRKLYEEELIEKRRVYSTLLDNLPGMVYRCKIDEAWTMLFVSDGCLKLTGYTPDDLIKNKLEKFANIIHPEDRDKVKKEIDEKNTALLPFQVEYRIITKTKNIKWVWEYGRLVKTATDSFLEGYIVDVTDSVLSRKELVQERKQLETTLYSIGDGVISTDTAGNVVMMNRIAEEMTGWKSSEAIGRRLEEVFNIINEYTRERCPNPVSKVLETGQIIGLANHTVLISKNGNEYIISDSAAPIKDEKGNIGGVILVFSDNTENKKAQDKVKESETKLKATFEAIPDLIFRNTTDGFFTDFHAGNEKDLLLPREEIIGTHISKVFDENFSGNLIAAFKQCAKTDEAQVIEYFIDTTSGREFYEARIVRYSQDEILSLCRNITQRKEAQKKMNESLKQQIILSDVSTLFNSNDSFELKVNQAFEMLGRFFKVDRVYLLENFDDNKYCKNTYEWCEDGIAKQIDNLQLIAYDDSPVLYEKINEDKIFVSKNIDEDLSGKEWEHFEKQNIKALIVLPVFVDNKFWGCVGFDDCKNTRQWTPSDTEFLKTVSNIIAASVEREIAFEAIRHEREQLEITLHSIGDGVIVTDTAGNVLLLNKIAEKLTGYTVQEAIGKKLEKVFNIINEHTGKKAANPVEKVLDTGNIVALENHTILISKSNERYIIADSAAPIKDKNGEIAGVVLVFRDDTEKRRQEDVIKQSEKNYRKLFDFANDPIFLLKDYKVVNCNHKTSEIFGFSKHEIIGHSPAAFSPEFQNDGLRSVEKATKLIDYALEGNPTYFEWEHQRKDGSTFTTEISLNRIELDSEVFVQAIVRDISQRKLYERALEESEEKYKTLVEKANDGIAIVQNGQFIFANKRLCEFTGYETDEVVNHPFLNFIDKEFHDQIIKYNNARLNKEEGVPSIYEITAIHKSGAKLQVELNSSYIKYNGSPAVLVVVRDVGARKEAEDKLRLFKATIENSSDAIGMSTPQGQHYYQNKAFDDLFGAINSNTLENIYKDPDVRKKVFETIMTGKAWMGEIEMVSKEGDILNVLLRAYANHDNKGNITALVGIHTDITERKQIVSALQKSEEKFRMLIESAADAFFQGDEKGNIILVNDEAVKLTGYTTEEMLGLNIQELFTKNTLQEKPLQYQTLEQGIVLKTEREVIRKNGSIVSVEMNSRKMPDGTYQSFFRDISQRKLAQVALVSSEEKYRLLFENITQGFALHEIITDDNGKPIDYRYISVNPAFGKLTGVDVNTMVGKSVKELMPNTEAYWIETFGNVALTGKPMHYENYSMELDKFYETWVFSPKHGQFAVIFSDVTKRKQAEDTIKAVLAINQMGEENLQDITDFTLKESVRVSRSEIAFLAFTNETNTKIKLHSFSENVFLNHKHENVSTVMDLSVNSLFYEAVNTRKPIIINDYQNYSGKKVLPNWHLEIKRVVIVPIEEDNKVVALATVANKKNSYTDADTHQLSLIIDRLWKTIQTKEKNDSIRKLNEDLLEKNKEMEQFVYVTSHDLRSPLVNIQGFTKELVSATEEIKTTLEANDDIKKIRADIEKIYKEDIDESLHYILLSAKKMDALLNGLLKLSRMGRVEPVFGKTNLNNLITEIIDSFEFQLEKKNITVEVEKLFDCNCDEVLMNQAFSNIIDNAIKYMDKEKGFIKISSKKEADKIIYIIEDNGPGISKEYHHKVFEIFQRLDGKTTGEGLGLSIVQKIIEKHNGSIWIESEIGEGCTFFIAIPC